MGELTGKLREMSGSPGGEAVLSRGSGRLRKGGSLGADFASWLRRAEEERGREKSSPSRAEETGKTNRLFQEVDQPEKAVARRPETGEVAGEAGEEKVAEKEADAEERVGDVAASAASEAIPPAELAMATPVASEATFPGAPDMAVAAELAMATPVASEAISPGVPDMAVSGELDTTAPATSEATPPADPAGSQSLDLTAAMGQPAVEFVPLGQDQAGAEDADQDASLEEVTWRAAGARLRHDEKMEKGELRAAEGETDSPEEKAGMLPEQGDPFSLPEEDFPGIQSSLGLLRADELLAPDLVVEEVPGQLMERLQQALGAGSAPLLADRAAEVVLPQVVRGLVSLVRDGVAEMRLQLQPPDLGEIELRVRTTEATVRGEMMVQHPAIKQLLEANLDRLRHALAQQGLQLAGFDVNVERDPRFAQQEGAWQQGERGYGLPFKAPSKTGEAPAVETAQTRINRGETAVDYVI